MTSRSRPYLLETDEQVARFRERFARYIQTKGPGWVRWINSRPWMEETRIFIPEGQEEVIIGIICLLHLDRYVNVQFCEAPDYDAIKRIPANDYEYQVWLDMTCSPSCRKRQIKK